MGITFYHQCKPYELDRGVVFRDMQTRATGTGVLSVGTATFDPGRYLPCHRHNCEEVIVILEGDAFVDVAGQRTPLKVYDSTHVPQGIPHRFVNASRTQHLTILWVYSVLDVERLVTDYTECMGAAPPEPGEDGYIAVRPRQLADLSHDELVARIATEVIAALRSHGMNKSEPLPGAPPHFDAEER